MSSAERARREPNRQKLYLVAELGPTIRAWRERMQPAATEDPSPRHTPGWRRPELALRAGLSTDYLTQLEQGRSKSPSEQVLKSLASALDLSATEREHLYELAGRQPPPPSATELPPSVLQMISQLHLPAALCNSAWDLIQWNTSWACIIGDASRRPVDERNIVLRHFHGLPMAFERDAAQAALFEMGIVADLRRSIGRNHDDPRLNAVINDLLATSARFRALWAAPAAAPYEREVKTFVDPDLGEYQLDCMVMDTRHLDYRVILLSAAPGSTGERKLEAVAKSA